METEKLGPQIDFQNTVTLDFRSHEFVKTLLEYNDNRESSLKRTIFFTRLMNHPTACANILLLGDQESPHKHALAPHIRKLGYSVVQTDFNFSRTQVDGELTQMKLDHNKPFPFHQKFDAILMRRGLCFCDDSNPNVTCGGLHKDLDSCLNFLLRVIEVFNLQNPRAIALLEGCSNLATDQSAIIEFWVSVAKAAIKAKPEVDTRVVLDHTGQKFLSLHLLPKRVLSQSYHG